MKTSITCLVLLKAFDGLALQDISDLLTDYSLVRSAEGAFSYFGTTLS